MLGFINTLVLSALALALIPVIIQLLNRKKSKIVPFSSLTFLKALQKKQIKRLKIHQWLLLVLRTLIIIFAVLAFARPSTLYIPTDSVRAHAKTSAVLIVDNSLSTAYRSEKGIVFDRIRNRALDLVDFLKEGDEAALLLATSPDGNGGFSQNFTEISTRLKQLKPAYRPADLSLSLIRAIEMMQNARNVNREIYILTDMQQSGFNDPIPVPPDISVIVISVPVTRFSNWSVDTAAVLTQILEKNRPIEIMVRLRNHSDAPVEDLLINHYLNGRRVGQSVSAIPPRDAITIRQKIMPPSAGILTGMIEIDDDLLIEDNRYYFNIIIPDTIRALLVRSLSGDHEFIRLALKPATDFQTPVQITLSDYSKLTSTVLSEYDVLILPDLPALPDETLRKIDRFVNEGGVILMMPGPGSEAPSLMNTLTYFGFGQLKGIAGSVPGETNSYAELQELSNPHPLISGIFEDSRHANKTFFLSPRFYKYLIIDQSGKSRTFLAFNNRRPFLEVIPRGRGHAALFTSSVHPGWSDMEWNAFFPPLIHRTVLYLHQSEPQDGNVYTKQRPVEAIIRYTQSDRIRIVDGEGHEFLPKTRVAGEQVIVSLVDIEKPGNYLIQDDNQTVKAISININRNESTEKKLSEGDLENYIRAESLVSITDEDNLEEYILKSRYGYELWKYFLLLTGFLMVTELYIAQLMYGKNNL